MKVEKRYAPKTTLIKQEQRNAKGPLKMRNDSSSNNIFIKNILLNSGNFKDLSYSNVSTLNNCLPDLQNSIDKIFKSEKRKDEAINFIKNYNNKHKRSPEPRQGSPYNTGTLNVAPSNRSIALQSLERNRSDYNGDISMDKYQNCYTESVQGQNNTMNNTLNVNRNYENRVNITPIENYREKNSNKNVNNGFNMTNNTGRNIEIIEQNESKGQGQKLINSNYITTNMNNIYSVNKNGNLIQRAGYSVRSPSPLTRDYMTNTYNPNLGLVNKNYKGGNLGMGTNSQGYSMNNTINVKSTSFGNNTNQINGVNNMNGLNPYSSVTYQNNVYNTINSNNPMSNNNRMRDTINNNTLDRPDPEVLMNDQTYATNTIDNNTDENENEILNTMGNPAMSNYYGTISSQKEPFTRSRTQNQLQNTNINNFNSGIPYQNKTLERKSAGQGPTNNSNIVKNKTNSRSQIFNQLSGSPGALKVLNPNILNAITDNSMSTSQEPLSRQPEEEQIQLKPIASYGNKPVHKKNYSVNVPCLPGTNIGGSISLNPNDENYIVYKTEKKNQENKEKENKENAINNNIINTNKKSQEKEPDDTMNLKNGLLNNNNNYGANSMTNFGLNNNNLMNSTNNLRSSVESYNSPFIPGPYGGFGSSTPNAVTEMLNNYKMDKTDNNRESEKTPDKTKKLFSFGRLESSHNTDCLNSLAKLSKAERNTSSLSPDKKKNGPIEINSLSERIKFASSMKPRTGLDLAMSSDRKSSKITKEELTPIKPEFSIKTPVKVLTKSNTENQLKSPITMRNNFNEEPSIKVRPLKEVMKDYKISNNTFSLNGQENNIISTVKNNNNKNQDLYNNYINNVNNLNPVNTIYKKKSKERFGLKHDSSIRDSKDASMVDSHLEDTITSIYSNMSNTNMGYNANNDNMKNQPPLKKKHAKKKQSLDKRPPKKGDTSLDKSSSNNLQVLPFRQLNPSETISHGYTNPFYDFNGILCTKFLDGKVEKQFNIPDDTVDIDNDYINEKLEKESIGIKGNTLQLVNKRNPKNINNDKINEQKEREINNLKNLLNGKNEEIEELKRVIDEKDSYLSQVKGDLKQKDKNIKANAKQLNEKDKEIIEMKEIMEDLNNQINTLKDDIDNKEVQINNYNDSKDIILKDMDNLKAEIENKEKIMKQKDDIISAMKKEIEILKSNLKNNELIPSKKLNFNNLNANNMEDEREINEYDNNNGHMIEEQDNNRVKVPSDRKIYTEDITNDQKNSNQKENKSYRSNGDIENNDDSIQDSISGTPSLTPSQPSQPSNISSLHIGKGTNKDNKDNSINKNKKKKAKCHSKHSSMVSEELNKIKEDIELNQTPSHTQRTIHSQIEIAKELYFKIKDKKHPILPLQKHLINIFSNGDSKRNKNLSYAIKFNLSDVDINKLCDSINKTIINKDAFKCIFKSDKNGLYQELVNYNNIDNINVQINQLNGEEELKQKKNELAEGFDLIDSLQHKLSLYTCGNFAYFLIDLSRCMFDELTVHLFLSAVFSIYSNTNLFDDFYLYLLEEYYSQQNNPDYIRKQSYYNQKYNINNVSLYPVQTENLDNDNNYGKVIFNINGNGIMNRSQSNNNELSDKIYTMFSCNFNDIKIFILLVALLSIAINNQNSEVIIGTFLNNKREGNSPNYNNINNNMDNNSNLNFNKEQDSLYCNTIGNLKQKVFIKYNFNRDENIQNIYDNIRSQIIEQKMTPYNIENSPLLQREITNVLIEDNANIMRFDSSIESIETIKSHHPNNILDIKPIIKDNSIDIILEYDSNKYKRETIEGFKIMLIGCATILCENWNNKNTVDLISIYESYISKNDDSIYLSPGLADEACDMKNIMMGNGVDNENFEPESNKGLYAGENMIPEEKSEDDFSYDEKLRKMDQKSNRSGNKMLLKKDSLRESNEKLKSSLTGSGIKGLNNLSDKKKQDSILGGNSLIKSEGGNILSPGEKSGKNIDINIEDSSVSNYMSSGIKPGDDITIKTPSKKDFGKGAIISEEICVTNNTPLKNVNINIKKLNLNDKSKNLEPVKNNKQEKAEDSESDTSRDKSFSPIRGGININDLYTVSPAKYAQRNNNQVKNDNDNNYKNDNGNKNNIYNKQINIPPINNISTIKNKQENKESGNGNADIVNNNNTNNIKIISGHKKSRSMIEDFNIANSNTFEIKKPKAKGGLNKGKK